MSPRIRLHALSPDPRRTRPAWTLSRRLLRAPAWVLCLLVAVFAGVGKAGAGGPAVFLPTGPVEVDLVPHLSVLEDPAGVLALADVDGSPGEDRFRPLDGRTASFGLTEATWWVRTRLHNPGAQPRDLVLRQGYAMLDHFEVFVVDGDRVLEHWHTGDRLPFASRPIAHRDFLFPFTAPAGRELAIYVRARSEGPVNVDLRLYDPVSLVPTLGREQLVLGALFGTFALLALATALLYGFVRDASFAWYVCYVVCYGSYMAVFNGLAYQYVWPDSPELAGVAQVVLLMLALYFLMLFSRSILHMRGVSRTLDLAYNAVQAVVLAILLASPFLSYGVLVTPISLTVGAVILMVIAMGVTGFRAGQAAAGYFLLAWSVFLVGVLAYLLKVFALLPHNVFTQYGFQIGSAFEFVLLALALGIRVREIRQQSRTDSLTGIANRSRFDELIEQAFAQSRLAGTPLSLLVMDVDHFKAVNDTHGHAVGDRVLVAVADALRRTVRAPAEACRYGGEEFAVVMPRTELAAALQQAEAIRDAIANSGQGIRVTASLGVACTQGHAFDDPRGLFRAADEALYAAKGSGRNRVLAWRPPSPASPDPALPEPA